MLLCTSSLSTSSSTWTFYCTKSSAAKCVYFVLSWLLVLFLFLIVCPIMSNIYKEKNSGRLLCCWSLICRSVCNLLCYHDYWYYGTFMMWWLVAWRAVSWMSTKLRSGLLGMYSTCSKYFICLLLQVNIWSQSSCHFIEVQVSLVNISSGLDSELS